MTTAAIERDPGLLLKPLPLAHGAIFDAIRSEGPIQWAPHLRAWLVTSYAECAKLLRHPAIRESSNEELWRRLDGIGGIDSRETLAALPYFPFWLSGADHKRMHEGLNEIAKKLLGEIVEHAGQLAQSHLEKALRAGGLDFARDFASRLYPEALFRALGLDRDISSSLGDVGRLAALFEMPRTLGQFRKIGGLFSKSHDTLASHVTKCLQAGKPALIREIVAMAPAAKDDSQADAVARMLAVMIGAGSETITGAVAYGVYELLSESGRNMEHREWPAVADDVIRHVSPVVALRRRVVEDVEVAGLRIRSGDPLVFALVAANHDAAFCGRDPHGIRSRSCGVGLAFGTAEHVCVGLRIARNILRSALSVLADAPRLRLCGEPVAGDSPVIRTCKSMPMEFI